MNGFSFTLTLNGRTEPHEGITDSLTRRMQELEGGAKHKPPMPPVSHYYQPNDKRKLYNYVIKTAWHSYKYIGTDQHKTIGNHPNSPSNIYINKIQLLSSTIASAYSLKGAAKVQCGQCKH
jgi:hypothetical protein